MTTLTRNFDTRFVATRLTHLGVQVLHQVPDNGFFDGSVQLLDDPHSQTEVYVQVGPNYLVAKRRDQDEFVLSPLLANVEELLPYLREFGVHVPRIHDLEGNN